MADEFPIGQWVNYNGAITWASNVKITAQSLDIYLSVNGSDSGSGTMSSPFKSLAKAKELVDSYSYLDQVRIYFMTAGTYANTTIEWNGNKFIGNGSRPGRLALIAFESTRTILYSGICAAGSTQLALNVNSFPAANTYQRKFLVRKNSSGVIQDERIINSHTINTITPSHGFVNIPAISDTFDIVQPAVIIAGKMSFIGFDGTGTELTGLAPSGVFIVNIELTYAFFVNSTAYLKEVFTYWTGAGIRVHDNSKVLCGFITTSPIFSRFKYLEFLGAPNDGAWAGAGINPDRIDPPWSPSGVIEGFFGSCWLYSAVTPYNYYGTIIVRGGCLNGNNASGPAINGNPANTSLILHYLLDQSLEAGNPVIYNPFEILITVGNAIEIKGGGNIYVYSAKISCPGHCVLVSKFATAYIMNGGLSGGTTNPANCGFITQEGGRIIHYGLPKVLGGTGGGADNRINEGAGISQPNSFFNTVGAVMGPGTLGGAILRT